MVLPWTSRSLRYVIRNEEVLVTVTLAYLMFYPLSVHIRTIVSCPCFLRSVVEFAFSDLVPIILLNRVGCVFASVHLRESIQSRSLSSPYRASLILGAKR